MTHCRALHSAFSTQNIRCFAEAASVDLVLVWQGFVHKIFASMDWVTKEEQQAQPAWYCARTQPKHEHIAAGNMARRLGLEVFHPRLRLERATRRGVVRVIEPLFPCYIFVRCHLEERIDEIRYINGISSFVHFGQRIPSVPD